MNTPLLPFTTVANPKADLAFGFAFTGKLPLVEEISVSLVAEVCATCRWWGRDLRAATVCKVISPDPDSNPLAYLSMMDSATEQSGLRTAPNFGCRLWQSKVANPETRVGVG